MPRGRRFVLYTATAVLAVLTGAGGFTFWYGKGYVYLSEEPAACIQCHIMEESYDSWRKSSHRSVTCNQCHLPHDLVGKYLGKIDNGFRHSYAFTFKDTQTLEITPSNLRRLNANCLACHEPLMHPFQPWRADDPERACVRCHEGVGHVY